MTAPQSPDSELEGADACLLEGRPAQAEAIYRGLLPHHPGNFAVLLGLGHALEQQGRWTEADALATSNSTFSFTAAMLNERASAPVRPDREQRGLVAFNPWDAPVLL